MAAFKISIKATISGCSDDAMVRSEMAARPEERERILA
jgi:hypothetical protein